MLFREVSTGGHNDLQHATEMARAMVTEYGMSDVIGPVALGLRNRAPFLAVSGGETTETVAEETAREIDREVKRLMTEAHARAAKILQEHRSALDALIRLLLHREVVEGDEVRRLLQTEAALPSRAASR
jgi:cell division protease FtsH